MARSWYMNECNSVLVGAKWCVWAKVLASDSWNVAYGEMSSEVSTEKKRRVGGEEAEDGARNKLCVFMNNAGEARG